MLRLFMTYPGRGKIWTPEKLMEGYSAMARDAAREREAEEWSDALIGDSSGIDLRATSRAPST